MSKYIIEKVDDPNLIEFGQTVLRNNKGIIAGGVFRGIIGFSDNGEIVFKTMEDIKAERSKDVDVFFLSKNDFEDFKSDVETWDRTSAPYDGPNSVKIMIPLGRTKMDRLLGLDLVHKFFGTPEEILDDFDFTILQCALYREDDGFYLIYGKNFKTHLENRVFEYVDEPEKSGHIIERMMRYVDYGFTPTEKTIKKCLTAFCQNYKNIENVKIDELLLNADFQLYYKDRIKAAEKLRRESKNKTVRWTRESSTLRDRMREQLVDLHCSQLQNEWLSFIYYLKEYWQFNTQMENNLVASFSSKYAANFNISILLEQINEGLSFHEVTGKCSKSAGDLGFSLIIDREYETRWIYSSYSLLKLLEFFHSEKDYLGLDVVQSFLTKILAYRFIPQSDKNFIQCISCQSMIQDQSCDCGHNTFLPMLEADVLLKTLTQKKNDKEWMKECLNFFSQIYDDKLDRVPTLYEWHEALENEMFEPNLPPSLMFSLMINDSMSLSSV